MSLSSTLSSGQRESLRLLLEVRADSLRRELGSALHDPQKREALGLPNRHTNVGDDDTAEVETAIDIASVARDAQELNDVAEAMDRLDKGTYGVCVDCDEEISWARLQAKPSAKRCIQCETAHERSTGRKISGL